MNCPAHVVEVSRKTVVVLGGGAGCVYISDWKFDVKWRIEDFGSKGTILACGISPEMGRRKARA